MQNLDLIRNCWERDPELGVVLLSRWTCPNEHVRTIEPFETRTRSLFRSCSEMRFEVMDNFMNRARTSPYYGDACMVVLSERIPERTEPFFDVAEQLDPLW